MLVGINRKDGLTNLGTVQATFKAEIAYSGGIVRNLCLDDGLVPRLPTS